MGMYGYCRRASCDEIARVLEAPEQMNGFLFGEAPEPPPSGGLLSRRFGGKRARATRASASSCT